jgi:hypothetical protein
MSPTLAKASTLHAFQLAYGAPASHNTLLQSGEARLWMGEQQLVPNKLYEVV